ncbi:hypothetical protein [Mycoplasma sp. HU2014]|uniref:hypothetical protein n=1 Tax=Mycoplasma sp. HU2014 TaxID=1664275 RepID=UPI00067C5FFE|nr:hypothetical protein [Mycoplasma sp. HU2014]KNG79537.1 membrane protein [Mycoplasma sp. HU2014]
MRKTVKLTILLLVVAVIYFGYSAWIDSVAIYAIRNTDPSDPTKSFWSSMTSSPAWIAQWKAILEARFTTLNKPDLVEQVKTFNGSTAWSAWTEVIAQSGYRLTGFMAPDSLLYTLLSPFKLILVGGVFAMFIPLLKQLLFNTIIGIKAYIKNRDMNVLFNYSKTIDYVKDLKTKIEANDFEGVKSAYLSYSGLAFKPMFLTNLMNEIYKKLIKFGDISVFASGCDSVLESINEMYTKEKRRAMNNGRGDEMFYDIKRGFEYSSYSSKYFVKYYEAMSKNNKDLGWRIFSIEISRFPLFLLFSAIPSAILSGILSTVILRSISSTISASVITLITFGSFILPWVLFAILLHWFYAISKTEYKINKRLLFKPALVYYLLLLLAAITITAGCIGIAQVGNIAEPYTAVLMTKWFGALTYLVLTTCLVMYVLATLVDNHRKGKELKLNVIISNIIAPLFIWVITTGANFFAIFATTIAEDITNWISGTNIIIMVLFWIYLFTSNFLINNLITNKTAKKLSQTKIIEATKTRKTKKQTAKN